MSVIRKGCRIINIDDECSKISTNHHNEESHRSVTHRRRSPCVERIHVFVYEEKKVKTKKMKEMTYNRRCFL
ncbi:hypothetical protein WA026_017015 [Henosepilachna vigintioctopunctata]|uniref:Uncharacterized protein n=1 Tax=Henosepilachna vigintioctopunctata TaxID=420089 RepID=A0AAW1TLH4_9CUCU